MSTSTATKRACDACHRRKVCAALQNEFMRLPNSISLAQVRCNGANPCQNCLQTSLTCTYNKPPQKKGPKGSRAKVISELKKSQELTTASPSSRDGSAPNSPMASPLFSRQVDLLSPELVDSCIVQYFDKMYTTIPILHRNWIQQRAMDMQASPESYCAVGSLCLYMIVQRGVDAPLQPGPFGPQSTGSPQQNAVVAGKRLFEDIKRIRNQTDYSDNPNTASIVTSFFLSAALFGLEKHNTAWYYLQEAITFAKIMRIHDEKSYRQVEPTDAMNRRLFWLLFISERFVFYPQMSHFLSNLYTLGHRHFTSIEIYLSMRQLNSPKRTQTARRILVLLDSRACINSFELSTVMSRRFGITFVQRVLLYGLEIPQHGSHICNNN